MKPRTILPLAVVTAVVVALAPLSLALAQESDKTPPKASDQVEKPDASQQPAHLEIPDQPYRPTPRAALPRTPAVRWLQGGYVSLQLN